MVSIPLVDTVTGPPMSELWKTRHDKARYQWSSLGLLTPTFALLIFLFLVPMGFAVYLGFDQPHLGRTDRDQVGLHRDAEPRFG